MKKRINILLSFLVVFAFLYLIKMALDIDDLVFPYPHEVLINLFRIILTRQAIFDILSSLLRIVMGLGLSILFSFPIGLFFGMNEKVYSFLEPAMDFLRSLPAIALIPLFIVFFGVGELLKIAIIFFGVSIILIINLVYGVRSVKESRIVAARMFRANNWQILLKIIIPESMPYLFLGLRISFSLSLIFVLVAEMMTGATYGIGTRIVDYQLRFDYLGMYTMIIISGIIGSSINFLVSRFEGKVVFWRRK
ncbi:MAG: ABC transporter permease [archaeon]